MQIAVLPAPGPQARDARLDPECRTVPGWRPLSGCRRTRATGRCWRSWNTSPIAGAISPVRRDSSLHPYFAAPWLRRRSALDLRGSGDSDGVLTDEYLPQELDDGVQAIDWNRPPALVLRHGRDDSASHGAGSTGSDRRPEAEGAWAQWCRRVDRRPLRPTTLHHMGGCLLGDNLSWASVMFRLQQPAAVTPWWSASAGGDMWHPPARRQRALARPVAGPSAARTPTGPHGFGARGLGRDPVPGECGIGLADGYSNLRVPLVST